MNGLTARSPGFQANERLCLTACARAEIGWGRLSRCGIGVMDVTEAKRKRQPKEKKVSVKFNSRPRQILLSTFLATCTILSYFFDSEQLFGE